MRKRLGVLLAAGFLPLLLGPVPAHAATSGHPPLTPTALTIGDQPAPMGVEGAPQFGWQPRDKDPGERQTAYEIRVFRPGTDRPLWSSGKVASARTSYVPYTGPALAPGTAYRWTVRTWDRHGLASPWARQAPFGTGIAGTDWQASWIRRTTAEKDDYTLARKEFAVDRATITGARLYLSASQQYVAYLNGREVDRGPAFAYPGEGYYQATDVTAALRAGRPATLGVLYHWYGAGQGRPAGEPGMLARLVIDHADGSRQVVTSDTTWRVTRGAWQPAAYRNGDGRDYIENVDGRVAATQAGWTSPGFDDSAWSAPQTATVPPLKAQQTRIDRQTVRPRSITTLGDGSVVADFGTVIPAVPRVRFRSGSTGRAVTMWAGYVRNPDGTVSNTPKNNQSTDLSYAYTQRDGDQTFEAFTYEGFRYLQVNNPGGPVDISAVVQHTAVDPGRAATLDTSDATVDAVFDLMRRSALYSAQEQFLDTPTREKGQFLADAANISRALIAGWGDNATSARVIAEFAASQARYWPDGRLNAVYPNGDGKRDIPDFTELYPGWAWEHYLNSGDRATLAISYPVSAAIAGYVRRYVDPATGLVTELAGGSGAYQYGIIDWPNRYGYDTTTTARTTVNVLAVDALRSTARLAEAIGRPRAEIDALRNDADTLAAAINAHLRRADGVYIDGLLADGTRSGHASQIANAYAVAFGVAPPESVATVTDYLVSLRMQMGPMTAHLLLAALHRAGRDDQVLARLTDAASLGWANVLARGGTFTWETWEAADTGDSMSHGWGSAALVETQQALLGVTVTAPAGRSLLVRPPVATALTGASGTLWTRAGTVAVRWSKTGAGTALKVNLPVNVSAEVRVPISGTKAPEAAGGDLHLVRIVDGEAVYRVGSGTATFTPRS